MANTENKQLPYESTQKDIRDEIGGVSGALKSTESTSRNVADILAEELARIAGHNASQVDYDNSTSQLSADNVQEAIDELASEKVDKEVDKGLSTNDYTDAEKTKLAGIEAGAEVNVQSDWNQTNSNADDYIKNKPSSEVKSATDTFTTVNGGLLEECNIELEPVQDLHGYDSPWVGGAGKNKMPLTLADIKSANTSGTWNDNVYTYRGIVFTILLDNGGNVIAIKANNTATQELTLRVPFTGITAGDYYANGCADGGSNTTFDIYFYNATTAQGLKRWDGTTNAVNLYDSSTNAEIQIPNSTDDLQYRIRIRNGYTANNLMFYPMIRLGTESDPTFEAYTNICPISGHTEVDLYNVGKNFFDCSSFETTTEQGVTATPNGGGTITVTNTATATSTIKFGQVTIAGDYILNGCPAGGSNSSYRLDIRRSGSVIASDYGSGVSVSAQVGDEIRLRFANNYSFPSGGLLFKPMLRKSTETDATFEPYNGELYQVQIGQTVYGGIVDLVSGEMTVTHGYKDMGSLSWSAPSANYQFFQTTISDMVNTYTTVTSNGHFMCSNYSYAQIIGNTTNEGMCLSVNYLRVRDNNYATVDAFTTAMSGVQFVYELATPFTIQLTPQQIETLVGQNNLSCPLDGQSIDSVKYREVFVFDDVEKVVSLRIPISMLGTDESGRSTASQSYASRDYFYKDGYMCKALTSISAGATLTLNTNYSQGTLADVLKAIENA